MTEFNSLRFVFVVFCSSFACSSELSGEDWTSVLKDKVANSVIRIEVEWSRKVRDQNGFLLTPEPTQEETIVGTAFVISEDGYAVTAAHVLYGWDRKKERPFPPEDVIHRSIKVIREEAWSKDPPRTAKPVGASEVNSVTFERDVALIKIEGGGPWKVLCLGGATPSLGTPLVAYGYSSRHASLSGARGSMKNPNGDRGDWETDLSVESGNSGGPVLTPDGTVIGMVRAGIGGTDIKYIVPFQRFMVATEGHTSPTCGKLVTSGSSWLTKDPANLTGVGLLITSLITVIWFAYGRRERSRSPIPIVGSVLIDIIADVAQQDAKRDRVAVVKELVVGGCAYNIFFHLSKMGHDCRLFSGVCRRSPFREMIEKTVRAVGGGNSTIVLSDDAPEGLFIAQRAGITVREAFSSTSVDAVNIDYSKLEAVLKRANVAVVDLSLSVAQLKKICALCVKTKTDLICNGTSDGRIGRLKQLSGVPFDTLICSADEFSTLTQLSYENAKEMEASEICKQAFSRLVIVTRAEKGFTIFDPQSSAKAQEYPAAETDQNQVVSTIGAGDAFTACYASARHEQIATGRSFSFDDFHNRVKEYVPNVLKAPYATPVGMPKAG